MSKYNGAKWQTKELPLPIDVIVAEYRQAKNPIKMIDILAEQCGVNPCRIAWILHRAGLEVDPKKLPRALRDKDSFDYVAYWEASEDAVICDRLKKQRMEAQSMPEFDEAEGKEIPERIKPCPAAGMKPADNAERKLEKMEAHEAFEKEEKIIAGLEAAVAAENELTPADIRRGVLVDAAVCVCTDRNVLYGEAEDNFAVIARMWSAYLGVSVSAWDVADMMILFKVARNATAERASRDTYVDIAGYAACGGGMIEAEK